MIPTTIFVVLLVLFTTKGPVLMHVAAPDQATCVKLADDAPETFNGKSVPIATDGGTPEATPVLDAQAFCHTVTKLDHA